MPEIDRRAFLRNSAAGVGIALSSFTRSTAKGAQDSRSQRLPNLVPVDPRAILELRVQLGRSNVLIPGGPTYAKKGLPENGRYLNIRPRVIALCQEENDVVNCVKWCKKYGLSPVARGGGHSYAGYSTTTDLLIDLGRLNQVKVDKERGMAVVGGAALNRDLRDGTRGGQYFLPGGTCLGVGVGGLVLGGGIGYNSRWAGLTSDSLVSTRIVTASGDLLDASADANSDLFWACRGGAGGSFGINTSFTFKLIKVPPTVTYFQLNLEGADSAFTVFTEYHKLMATSESRLNAVARANAVKIGVGGKRDGIDVMSRGQFIGSERELKGLLTSYLGLKSKWVMKEMTFWEAAARFSPDDPPTPSHSFGDISRYVRKPVSDGAIGKQIDLLRKCPGRSDNAIGPSGSLWSLGWVGGEVMNKYSPTDTAYVHRGMSTLLRPTCSWPNGDKVAGDELRAWTREMIGVIAPETPNESYQNFPNREIEDWPQQYYAENLSKLIEIKTRYDRDNLFNNAQSIPVKSV